MRRTLSWLFPFAVLLGISFSGESLGTEVRRPAKHNSSTQQRLSVWTEPATGMQFVQVPGGSFLIGDQFGEGDLDEKTSRRVTLQAFHLGVTEVTQAQWQTITGWNFSRFKGEHHPVERVNWNDVQAFIAQLNARHGGRYRFRLPTEAEWEYACREGGRKVRYCNGKAEADQSAIHFGYTYTAAGTRPVASFAPNALGLYDMSGNVWEWTCSEYKPHYDSSEERCGRAGSPCTLRGGSWGSGPRGVRASNRNVFYGAYGPDGGDGRRGFRLVRE